MANNLISIIIPVFNREEIIKKTLDSILAQTYPNWECLLVDDGSSDNTIQTINYYIQKDNRFKFFQRPGNLQKGANACRNFGFTQAKGYFVNWFDSDDIMEPNFLKEKAHAFLDNTDAVLHRNKYSNYQLTRFRESKFTYSSPNNLFCNYALDEIEIQTSCLMWKKAFLMQKQLFNENIHRFQDNEFHIRMLALKPEIIVLDSVLATIRGGDGDSSQISSTSSLTKKKLYDIFYYRYQALMLNQLVKGEQFEKINKIVSKKALWTFYDSLKFENSIFKKFKDVKVNYGKLKNVYSIKEITLKDIIKSHLYLCYIVIFGNSFYNRK